MPGFWKRLTRREEADNAAAGEHETGAAGTGPTEVADAADPDAATEALKRTGPISDVLYSAAGNSADMAPEAPPGPTVDVLYNAAGHSAEAESEPSTLIALEQGDGGARLASPAAELSAPESDLEDLEDLLEI